MNFGAVGQAIPHNFTIALAWFRSCRNTNPYTWPAKPSTGDVRQMLHYKRLNVLMVPYLTCIAGLQLNAVFGTWKPGSW